MVKHTQTIRRQIRPLSLSPFISKHAMLLIQIQKQKTNYLRTYLQQQCSYSLSVWSCLACVIQALYPTKISLEPMCRCKSLHKYIFRCLCFIFLTLRSIFCLPLNLLNLNMIAQGRLSWCYPYNDPDQYL